MSLWSWLRERLSGRGRRAAHAAGADADTPGDPHTAYSRASGGGPDDSAADQHRTTGTTPSGENVGRAAGDTGHAGTTGAGARAEQPGATRPARRRIVSPPSG